MPEAGEFVRVVENDRTARSLAGEKAHRIKTESAGPPRRQELSARGPSSTRERGALVNELNLVLKADVSGSLEAFQDEIAELLQDQANRGRGSLSASAASPSPTSTSPPPRTRSSSASTSARSARPRQLADREGVEIRGYSVTDRAIDELRDAMQGMLAPEEVEEAVGSARGPRHLPRLEDSVSSRAAMVTDGHATRGVAARLVRDGTIVYDGEIGSLRRFNDDVREVQSGFECGVVLKDYMDVKEGDVIEVYETRQVERTLS